MLNQASTEKLLLNRWFQYAFRSTRNVIYVVLSINIRINRSWCLVIFNFVSNRYETDAFLSSSECVLIYVK